MKKINKSRNRVIVSSYNVILGPVFPCVTLRVTFEPTTFILKIKKYGKSYVASSDCPCWIVPPSSGGRNFHFFPLHDKMDWQEDDGVSGFHPISSCYLFIYIILIPHSICFSKVFCLFVVFARQLAADSVAPVACDSLQLTGGSSILLSRRLEASSSDGRSASLLNSYPGRNQRHY